MSKSPARVPRYHGPSLSLSEEEIVRLGGCVFSFSGDGGRFSEADSSIVSEIAARLTDAHVDAALEAAGLRDTESAQTLMQRATTEGGSAAYLRARLESTAEFSAGGCALGAAEVVVGVATAAIAGAEEVGSAGLLTPGAVLTAVVAVAFISQGIVVMHDEC